MNMNLPASGFCTVLYCTCWFIVVVILLEYSGIYALCCTMYHYGELKWFLLLGTDLFFLLNYK
nr:hypothetical protein Itr_chr09CG19660 [Ipomoea trifida]